MATLYYANQGSGDWADLANWLQDDQTTPATALPGPSDDVFIGYSGDGNISTNSGGPISVNSAEFTGYGNTLNGGVEITASASIAGWSGYTFGTWSDPNSVFLSAATVSLTDCFIYGTVTGETAFYNTSATVVVVTGSLYASGGVLESLTLNGGNATFDSVVYGLNANTTGTVTFINSAEYRNDPFQSPTQTGGTITFRDFSFNYGQVSNAIFRDYSQNAYDYWTYSGGGEILGTSEFHDYSNDSYITYAQAAFHDFSQMYDPANHLTSDTLTFNDDARADGFYEYSFMQTQGDTYFNDRSFCRYLRQGGGAGTHFRGRSLNKSMLDPNSYEPVVSEHGGGINGSSILGVV